MSNRGRRALESGERLRGRRFIASEEANAPAGHKQMIIDSRAEGIG